VRLISLGRQALPNQTKTPLGFLTLGESVMGNRLTYRDLKARGYVNNRETLRNWIKKKIFPPGKRTGPNSRTWDDDTEIQPWLASCPVDPKPAPVVKKPRSEWKGRPGRPRRIENQTAADTS
jgi:hypothetical protein